MTIKDFITLITSLWFFVVGGIATFYDYRTSRYFYYLEHKGEEERLFIVSGRRRLPFLIFSKEYKDFLINGDKEEIAKMKYYVRVYFSSSAVAILLALILGLTRLF